MGLREIKNYIYYVSDRGQLPSRGHLCKMDKESEIAEHIAIGLGNCSIIKSSEYDGHVVFANSVGIIFSTHSWGISLAVYSFMANLRVAEGTYVYAVAVGERAHASLEKIVYSNSMESFERMFIKNNFGNRYDIFVRCGNIKRTVGGTEEKIRYSSNIRGSVEAIANGLLYYSLEALHEKRILVDTDTANAEFYDGYTLEEHEDTDMEDNVRKKSRFIAGRSEGEEIFRLNNVFLDEDMLAGVRLCQGI